MSLAIFDLDNTLLAGDSDYLWGEFLSEQGLVDGEQYKRKNLQFYEDYKKGSLDIYEFLAFSLNPLTLHEMDELMALRAKFMQQKIEPIVLPKAEQLVHSHRQNGDELLIITATNNFVTSPIAKRFGIATLLATEAELDNQRYTGRVSGTPCFQQGKVTRLQQWLTENGHDLRGSYFYSDSHNDIPLLSLVDNPVAVDPDDKLRQHALKHHWPVVSLRDE